MINRLSFLLLIILVFAICNFSYGQKCLSSQKRTQVLNSYPHLNDWIEENEAFTRKWIMDNEQSMATRELIRLPVVVHVLWRESQENISEEQILSQIDVLNKDFRKLNDNFNDGPQAFQSFGADVEIEFCLASVDPSGNSTNGITRTQTNVDDIGMTNNFYQSSNGGHDAWDIDRYINIWVCDLGDDGVLGFATPPGFADPIQSDGLVIGYQFFGTTGVAANSAPNHLGRTATHEMGHYFNLEHLWGPGDGGCYEDDSVGDTPLQETSSEDCSIFPSYDYCTYSGDGIMYNNYMDYSSDECMTMFTQGQKMRMLAALNGPRSSLLNNNETICNLMTSVDNQEESTNVFSVYPNPTADYLYIESTEDCCVKPINASIYDVNGEKMMGCQLKYMTKIDVSQFPNGVYFIQSDEVMDAYRFIITR